MANRREMALGAEWMVRKIVGIVNDRLLRPDLERYRKNAVTYGAINVRVIATD